MRFNDKDDEGDEDDEDDDDEDDDDDDDGDLYLIEFRLIQLVDLSPNTKGHGKTS